MNRHIKLFNGIAFAYQWFFGFQRRMFGRIIAEHMQAVGAVAGDSFLDVGCGTGAFAAALNDAGFKAEGVDGAPRMVERAARSGVRAGVADIMDGLPFPDKSFDFVVSSYVAHGLTIEPRRRLYTEAGRIARKLVIIHDYDSRRRFVTDFVERMEGGDYFNFVLTAEQTMKECFKDVKTRPVAPQTNWYLCRPEPAGSGFHPSSRSARGST
jgi:SAM-dependent methyltransferase